MINFIIYEDEKQYRDKYISIIVKMMGESFDNYQITELEGYNTKARKAISSTVGKKVYILDIEVPGKSGLDFAREIRNSGDWDSQIIIVTTHDHLQLATFTSRLLTIDFVSKYNNLTNHLRKALITSYTIVTRFKTLKVQSDGELFPLFYNDICFIKKEADDLDVRIILKDGTELEVKDRIGKIEEDLKDDPRFLRTHRGCIINVTNIKSVDFSGDKIKFDNSETSLLSRDKKKELRERIFETQVANNDKLKK